MQITTVDTESKSVCSIDLPLRRLTKSDDAKEAAYWRKFLELVEHLQSRGTKHELRGYILLRELNLWVPYPPDPSRSQAMKEFADEWRRSNPGAETRRL